MGSRWEANPGLGRNIRVIRSMGEAQLGSANAGLARSHYRDEIRPRPGEGLVVGCTCTLPARCPERSGLQASEAHAAGALPSMSVRPSDWPGAGRSKLMNEWVWDPLGDRCRGGRVARPPRAANPVAQSAHKRSVFSLPPPRRAMSSAAKHKIFLSASKTTILKQITKSQKMCLFRTQLRDKC